MGGRQILVRSIDYLVYEVALAGSFVKLLDE